MFANTDTERETPNTPDHTLLQVARVLIRNVVEDKKQKYFLYIPSRGGSGKPVFVTVHGVKRMAVEHAVEFSAFAELYDVVLVAPLFPKKQFCDYQRLGRQGRGNRADRALHRILNDVSSLTGANINKLYMFGYSGGGQFVHRYAMANPRHAVRIVVAAAGWYTFPDTEVNYPRGVKKAKGLQDIRFDPSQFLSVPTCVVVGDRDVHRNHELNKSARIDRQQGITRLERGKRWIRAMAASARYYCLDTPYLFKALPRCNHSFIQCMHRGKMGNLVFDFLFGKLNRVVKSIIVVFCLSLLVSNAAEARMRLYKKDDLKVTMDTRLKAKNAAKNYCDTDSLHDSESYDYWYNYIDLGMTARGTDWMARLKLHLSDMRDDDHALTGDDEDGELWMDEAFLKYKFPNNPFFFVVGRSEQSFGTKMFYGYEYDTGLTFGYEPNDMFALTVGRFVNKETRWKREDHDMSFVKGDVELNEKNSLLVFLVHVGEHTDYDANHPKRKHDRSLYNLGINFKGKINNVDFEVEGNKQFGSYRDYVNVEGEVKKINYKGYAMMAKGHMAIGRFRPEITIGYGSGDNCRDTEQKAFIGYEPYYQPDNIVIDDGLAHGSGDTISNLEFVRFDIRIKCHGKLRITPGIGYYRHVKSVDVEDSAGRPVSSAKEIGTEVDINFHYRIDKYVLFRFNGGYLFADEGTGISDSDNAWKTETSIRVDF